MSNVINIAFLRGFLNKTDIKQISSELNKEVHLTQQKEGKMNKELVEKEDDLLKKLKNLLEEKLEK